MPQLVHRIYMLIKRSAMAPTSLVTRQHLRVSYEQLVAKQQFDKIMDVLLKEQNSDTLRLWLEGKMPSTIQPTENIGETALHRIAVVHPPAWIVEALVNCLDRKSVV